MKNLVKLSSGTTFIITHIMLLYDYKGDIMAGLTGSEKIFGHELLIENETIRDFWSWAFSDLKMNDTRGVFAEWMVAKLLDIPLNVRDSWQECDLITPEKIKIEVKTSAYVQAWEKKNKKESSPEFGGLKSRKLVIVNDTYKYAENETYNADLYVFCFQMEKDKEKYNALDLTQWRFFTLLKEDFKSNQGSISLNSLSKRCPPMTASQFQKRAMEMIRTLSSFSHP